MNKVVYKQLIRVLLHPAARRRLYPLSQRFYALYTNYWYGHNIPFSPFQIEKKGVTIDDLDIKEALYSSGDVGAIRTLCETAKKDKMLVAEVGSWKGMSTAVFAKIASAENGKVFAVDRWEGCPGTPEADFARTNDIFSIFRTNMIMLGIWNSVFPLVMYSDVASKLFADGTLDIVFLDADHRYSGIKNDIDNWLPKLKEGGILCGHDCDKMYSECTEEQKEKIDENLEVDLVPGIGHGGVIKAFYDSFGQNYRLAPESCVAYYVKGKSKKTPTPDLFEVKH